MAMALGVALTSRARFRHGAVVVRGGKVVGVSPNIQKNNPEFVDWRFSSIHAERAAMRKAGWPKRAIVYVARINRAGNMARFSKPCMECQRMLDELKCSVVYTKSE